MYVYLIETAGTGASLVAQMVKNLPAMQETWIQSLGQEDALEKGKTIHSNIHYFLKFYLFILIGG